MTNTPVRGRANLKVIHPTIRPTISPAISPTISPGGSSGGGPAQAPTPAPRAARKSPQVTLTPKPGNTQRIVDSITTAIAERRLMPGTKLPEQKLADIFKVSRTLVRQALNQLSRDRLVVLEPARGAFVATPSVEEAHQVFEVRQILEVALTRRLCAVISNAQIAELRRHLQAQAEAVSSTNVSGRTRLLADFHLVLAQMLGNRVLSQLMTDLLTRSSLISLMYPSSPSAEHALAAHAAIVDAFEQRNVELAVRLTVEHLEHVEQHLRLTPRETDLAQVLNPPSP